jgi:hypothetical protein
MFVRIIPGIFQLGAVLPDRKLDRAAAKPSIQGFDYVGVRTSLEPTPDLSRCNLPNLTHCFSGKSGAGTSKARLSKNHERRELTRPVICINHPQQIRTGWRDIAVGRRRDR